MIGVLLTNLGTPDAPTTRAVRRYLAEFLNDRRVVEINPWLWQLILRGFILPFRSPRSAKLYQKVWTTEGSPLRVILHQQAQALQQQLGENFLVVPAMRYGEPSLAKAFAKLISIKKILLLPLYPQYCAATTATTFDAVAEAFKRLRWQPALRTITGYHEHNGYIELIVQSIQQHWQTQGKTTKLLFSFHGLPQAFCDRGDPYANFCQATVTQIVHQLALSSTDYFVAFQSRLGRTPWLQPYTDQVLQQWGQSGIKSVTVICPGFSADCLETIEEINQTNRELFLQAGGEVFHYIPALNAQPAHIDLLAMLVQEHTQGWHLERV